MSPGDGRAAYRRIVDELVSACREGEGQIGPDRVRRGSWIPSPRDEADERADAMLARLGSEDREVVATLLEDAFASGVHATLRVLEDEGVPPFDESYEGTPYQDFVGRLIGWEWPKENCT